MKIKIHKRKINYLINILFTLILGGFVVIIVLDSSYTVQACGTCDCTDYGPGPKEDGGKYGWWCTHSCGSDCDCSASCKCGNSYTCGPCPCTPGCGCTPNCASGTSTSKSSDHNCKAKKEHCSCTDDCGTKIHHYGATCYKDEPNTVRAPASSRLYLCFDNKPDATWPNEDQCIPLSKSSSRPTIINLPSSNTGIYLKTRRVSNPSPGNNDGVRYKLRVDEKDSDWGINCSPVYNNDYCTGWLEQDYSANLNKGDGNDIGLDYGKTYHMWSFTGTEDDCDEQVKSDYLPVHGYLKVNTPPQILSVETSPTSGLSGNEPDEDPDSSCDDRNPQEFTTVYYDADGCSDMTIQGLWLSSEDIGVSHIEDSMHGVVKRGSDLRILAEGDSSLRGAPIMELLIDNVPVKYFRNITDYTYYEYRHHTSLSADQIKIRFINDHCDNCSVTPKVGDRNLRVDKIILDGRVYETEDNATSNDCCATEWLCCQNGYFQYHGNSTIPSGHRMYGYDFIDQGFDCDGNFEDSEDCWQNYTWFNPTKGFPANATFPYMCSPQEGSYDDQKVAVSGNPCLPAENTNAENTKVAWSMSSASCSANTLTIKWKLWFYDYLGSSHENDFHTVVADQMGAYNSGKWTDIGDWNLDLDPPSGTLDIKHDDNEAADSLTFYLYAFDNGTKDTGVRRIFDQKLTVDRVGGDLECDIEDGNVINGSNCSNNGDNELKPDNPEIWPGPSLPVTPDDAANTHTSVISGFEGGDDVDGTFSVEDAACNLSSAINDPTPPGKIGEEWMITKFGDVYSALGYDVPLINDEHFATYWIAGNVHTNWDFASGDDSKNNWKDSSYLDHNSNSGWYGTLYRLAKKSDWATLHGISSGESVSLDGQIGGQNSGIYVYTGNDTLTFQPQDCSGRKVIFVPTADVVIQPDIKADDENSACLVIARENVTVVSGSDAGGSDNEDFVQLGIITDGDFVSEEDIDLDALRIRGFVFANTVEFDRDLVFEANLDDPAEILVYDPRYLYLLKDMLGRRAFEEFECGASRNISDICEGW